MSPYGEFEILSQKFFVFFLSDLGYQSVDAYQTLVVTVWIPFVDSNEQNGCLQVKKSTFYIYIFIFFLLYVIFFI